jgi:Zn-dependent M28 family amino/carboxypeptidase
MARRRAAVVGVAALAVAALTIALAADSGGGRRDGGGSGPDGSRASRSAEALARSVTVAGLVEHLRALERVAARAGGNRAAGTTGDRDSARYVIERLRAAGWRVRLQPVRFPYSEQRSPPSLVAAGRTIETAALAFSGSGSVSVALAPAGSGCREEDYASLPRGAVALVRRGACFLRRIVLGAQRAGAAAVIVYDDQRPGAPLPGTLISPGARIPAVAVRQEDGRALARDLPQVRLRVDAVSEARRTRNVIAELGSGSQVAMAGAHIDSVAAGPGINDNGSGVATLVELAEQIGASRGRPRRRLRFAFWGAEELGLYGSRRYVRALARAERRRIVAYLNLDMVGSENGGRLLYGGTRGAAARAAAAVRAHLRARGVRIERTDPRHGSDHAPFEAAGVPIIGLFSGASETKRQRDRSAWGGRAGRPFHPCYHLGCDRLSRIDRRTLSDLSDAAAVAVHAMAFR